MGGDGGSGMRRSWTDEEIGLIEGVDIYYSIYWFVVGVFSVLFLGD